MIARTRGGTTSPHTPPGVSLIEVLLATAIFLISLAALSVLLRGATDDALDADRTNLCSRLARTKMAELEAGVGEVSVSTGGVGTFADFPNYNWEVIPGQAAFTNAYDVTVRVWSDAGGRTVEVSLSQVVIDPTFLNNAAALQAPTTTTEAAP